MSVAELEDLRARNRAALGLGMADSVPGGVGVLPDIVGIGGIKVRVGSAFPEVDYIYDPAEPSPPSEGSPVAEWLNRHVVRPVVEVQAAAGTILRYAPGDGHADYSGLAKGVALLGVSVGALFGAWTLARAFTPTRRIA